MVGEVGVEPTMLPIRTRFTVWGCTRHSINSPVLLAEDKGIEPSTFRWRSFQDCVSTIDAILHILGACHGNRTHAYWSARPARERCSIPRLRYLHKQISYWLLNPLAQAFRDPPEPQISAASRYRPKFNYLYKNSMG